MPDQISIDQTPLTAAHSVAPNILLMMDDSGSMAWDYMPDWGYLADTTTPSKATSSIYGAQPAPGPRDSAVNGVYYNPNTLYTPPPKVDGTSYPNSQGLTKAYTNPFTSQNTADVTRYYGGGNGITLYYYSNFNTQLQTYDPPTTRQACDNNYYNLNGDGTQCVLKGPIPTVTQYTCPAGYSGLYTYQGQGNMCRRGTWSEGTLVYDYQPATNVQPGCPWPTQLGTDGMCHYQGSQEVAPYTQTYCPNGGNLSNNNTQCTAWQAQQYFTYATGQPGGPYSERYVGADGTCAQIYDSQARSQCVDESTPGDGSNGAPAGVTVGQNVANWFSYYRTRMLTAKTGLMKALAGMQPDTRFGFGSINGSGVANLPSPTYDYKSAQTGQTNSIAEVKAFGTGGNGTQRASFWNWLAKLAASGQTPLREALNQAGKYYQTDQPWQSDDGVGNTTQELACRQSYTILTTDGFWNGPDQSGTVGGNVDGSKGPTVKRPDNTNYVTYTPALPFSDTYSGTLADVAQYYWENDLQPDMPNEVPPGLEDPAFWQHMGLFTLGMGFQPSGLSGTVNGHAVTVPDIFNWSRNGSPVDGFQWPQPSSNSLNNIADLVHAAVNGHGGYYSALDPVSFTAGIQSALQRIQQRAGTGASFGANGPSLQANSVSYQTLYSTGKWNGDLQAFSISSTTGATAKTPNWAAAGNMPDWKARRVWTYNPDAGNGNQFFQITASSASELATTLGKLSYNEKKALASRLAGQSPSAAMQATEQGNMLQYLLGDHTLETTNAGGVYRTRDGSLGDIVNSSPVYVGAPDANAHPQIQTYLDFVSEYKGRSPVVWVAANDGMLHEFDATTGKELFAYLPGAVITENLADAAWQGIANYADPNYGGSNPHEYFNDGQLTVADANLNGQWKTVLVGTTGRGAARAIYAVDITDPANPKPMWEHSADDGKTGSSYIGQNISTPVIAQTADGWQVFMGNGYNSASGKSALLQYSLASGDLTVYPTDDEIDNGMAPPSIWIGSLADGYGTFAYAGDLLGRVWQFNLGDAGSAGTQLFQATDDHDNPQPITGGMLAGKDPTTQARWVFFGTGKYLTHDDLVVTADTPIQTWYGLIVDPGSGTNAAVGQTSNRGSLVERFINSVAGNPAATPPRPATRVITGAALGPDKAGWFIDLQPTGDSVPHGERIVVANQFQSGWLLATTNVPGSSNLCNPTGTGWVMALSPFTGTNPGSIFFDLNGDDVFTDADKVTLGQTQYAAAGIQFQAVPNAPVFVGSRMLNTLDNATRSNINTAGPTTVGQVSWREVVTHH
ncbi:MAG TPA: PilC/PilY family type IV pilus protein [Nevskiaceae bacterium]